MISRRKFIQFSTATLPLLTRPLWAKTHIPLGLQLYTLRTLYPHNLPKVLREVRAIGYEEIELPSDLPSAYPADKLRAMIEESGLVAPSGHFDYEVFPTEFNYAKNLGLKWMVISAIPGSMWGSLDGFREAARKFNDWGKRLRNQGMRFAFHTHAYEFRVMQGTTGFETIVKETDPELVFFEIDCYWVTQAGHDPVQLLNRLGRRVRMLHLKDRKPGFPPSTDMGPGAAHFTEVGSGTIDWRRIFATAEKLGVEHYFVEQDETDGPPLESVRKSYNYLRTIVP
jgi:sugar phosphate isomerase/epimerase